MATISGREKELLELYHETGIDLSDLPPIMTTRQLAPVLGVSYESLVNSRQGLYGTPIPYVKIGRRVRYLKADVIKYLLTNRVGGAA